MRIGKQFIAIMISAMIAAGTIQLPVIATETITEESTAFETVNSPYAETEAVNDVESNSDQAYEIVESDELSGEASEVLTGSGSEDTTEIIPEVPDFVSEENSDDGFNKNIVDTSEKIDTDDSEALNNSRHETGAVIATDQDIVENDIADAVDTADTSEITGKGLPEEGSNDSIEMDESKASASEEDVAQENNNEDVLVGEFAAEENVDEAPSAYTVTLDANGGYFVNEWDDLLGEYVKHAEILNKVIPVEGIVSIVPVNVQDGITSTFLGWSLDRDGEILPKEQEGYVPAGDCVLYAIWQVIESENVISNTKIDENYEADSAEEVVFRDNKEEVNEEKIERIDEETSAAVHATKSIGEYPDSDKAVPEETKKVVLQKEKRDSLSGSTAEIAIDNDDSNEESVSEEAMGAATYAQREYNGHMYQLFNEGVTWSTAKSRCKAKGGYLVTITSSGEYSFCKSLLGDLSPKYCWMGATHASGTWKWITGESWGFTAWSPNQPNGSGGGTYALMQNFKGVGSAWNWDDQGNSGTSPSEKYRSSPYYHLTKNYCYICEWDANLSNAVITGIDNKAYTGDEITQNPSVVLGGKKLRLNVDYKLSYKNNIQCGTATVVITGTGSYKGTVSRTFKITKLSIANALITGVFDKVYTGKEIKPTPIVSLGLKLLGSDDYTVSYENNIDIGTATLIVTGKGNYRGTVKKNFRIGRSIIKASVTGIKNRVFTKAVSENGAVQSPTVKLDNILLECDRDYVLIYTANKKPGTASVRISGRGDYVGSVSKNFEIKLATPSFTLESENHGEVVVTPGNIFGATGYEAIFINNVTNKSVTGSSIISTGKKIRKQGLSAGKSYSVIVRAVRRTGKEEHVGNYSSSESIDVYKGESISSCKIYIDNDASGEEKKYSYTGIEIEPVIKLVKKDKTLTNGTDYIVNYTNNINEGTAHIEITGNGKYYGTLKREFRIIYPFIKERSTWYYRGEKFAPSSKLKKYELDGDLVIQKPLTLPSGINISCKTLKLKENLYLGTQASVTASEDMNLSYPVVLNENASLKCDGKCTLQSSLGMYKNTTLTTGKNFNVNTEGSINMKDGSIIDVGQTFYYNPNPDLADESKLEKGTIRVAEHVTIKGGKLHADVGHATVLLGNNKKHTISVSKEDCLGTVDLSEIDIFKLNLKGDGKIHYLNLKTCALKECDAIKDSCLITFVPDDISEAEKNYIQGQLFVMLFLSKYEGNMDLLKNFYSSAEGVATFSSSHFDIPVCIPIDSENLEKAKLNGNISTTSNKFVFGNLSYKRGAKTINVIISSDPSKVKSDFSKFMNDLSKAAVKEEIRLIYQDVLMEDLIGILCNGGFTYDTTKIGFELWGTKALKDVNDYLSQIQTINNTLDEKFK